MEVYDFKFEGGEKAYEDLVKLFFMFHDPTTVDRQGNDRGTQYASHIFVYDQKQVLHNCFLNFLCVSNFLLMYKLY